MYYAFFEGMRNSRDTWKTYTKQDLARKLLRF